MIATIVKTLFITTILLFSVYFYALSSWFDNQSQIVHKISQEYKQEVKKLQKVAVINDWLEEKIIPFLATLPKTQNATDKKLIDFYDRYANSLNFEITKYLYHDEGTYKMKLYYAIPSNDIENIQKLFHLEYPTGYVFFNSLEKSRGEIKGELTVVQPILGDLNVSQ